MVRRWFAAALVGALLASGTPLPAGASGSFVETPRGVVVPADTGTAEELELSGDDLEAGGSLVTGRLVGIISPDPADPATDTVAVDAVLEALSARLGTVGARVERCEVGPDRSAAGCMDTLFLEEALAIVVVGDHGNLREAAEIPLRNRTIVVGVGPTVLGDGAITLDIDPMSVALEQGRAAGRAMGPVAIRRKGNALSVGGDTGPDPDALVAAVEDGLRQTARKVKVTTRVGPPALHTVADLEAVLGSLPPVKLVVGDGLLLDEAVPADLERLPASLRLVAWRCTPGVEALVDAASRVRGCVDRAEDLAGRAAANAILTLLAGRDVAGRIEVPVYVYRGTMPVGPGRVQLGRRVAGDGMRATEDERRAAAATLGGRTVGVVTLAGAAQTAELRQGLDAALDGIGLTVDACEGSSADQVRECVTRLSGSGVAAIVTLGTGVDLTREATAAVEAGVPVVGVSETRLGESGAVYVIVNPSAVGRTAGRMAGRYAATTWPGEYVLAAVLNNRGARGDDFVADALERALLQTNSSVQLAGRFRSKDEASARKSVNTILRRYPGVRLVLGRNALRAEAPILADGGDWNEMAIIGLDCDADLLAAINASVVSAGRAKGCVDRDPVGAGTLAGQVLVRLAAGGSVPEVLEVPVAPYLP
jgi:hypothetical protein